MILTERKTKNFVVNCLMLNSNSGNHSQICTGLVQYSGDLNNELNWYFRKYTEPLCHAFVYSLVSLLSRIYPLLAMHSLLVTIL